MASINDSCPSASEPAASVNSDPPPPIPPVDNPPASPVDNPLVTSVDKPPVTSVDDPPVTPVTTTLAQPSDHTREQEDGSAPAQESIASAGNTSANDPRSQKQKKKLKRVELDKMSSSSKACQPGKKRPGRKSDWPEEILMFLDGYCEEYTKIVGRKDSFWNKFWPAFWLEFPECKDSEENDAEDIDQWTEGEVVKVSVISYYIFAFTYLFASVPESPDVLPESAHGIHLCEQKCL